MHSYLSTTNLYIVLVAAAALAVHAMLAGHVAQALANLFGGRGRRLGPSSRASR